MNPSPVRRGQINFDMITEHDKKLIAEARHKLWEDIDEDAAETDEGRLELHRICVTKYHREEFFAGML